MKYLAVLLLLVASCSASPAFAAPASAVPLNLSYCLDKPATVERVRGAYPDATASDRGGFLIFNTAEEPTSLVIYFDDQGCALSYEIVAKTTA